MPPNSPIYSANLGTLVVSVLCRMPEILMDLQEHRCQKCDFLLQKWIVNLFDSPARPEEYIRDVGDDDKLENEANDVRYEELSDEMEVCETCSVMHRDAEQHTHVDRERSNQDPVQEQVASIQAQASLLLYDRSEVTERYSKENSYDWKLKEDISHTSHCRSPQVPYAEHVAASQCKAHEQD